MTDKEEQQAFPVPVAIGPSDGIEYGIPGMTLRQWYAGQALAGAMAGYLSNNDLHSYSDKDIALDALKVADALIAELSE